jgi:glycosyltransferase involved in cell wall biosynthesis
LLILTSEYEGFPLVLAEAMSFGVIPVVYGSYSAVYDIISDGVDGVILPYNKKGYDTEFATEKMKELMLDADKRNNLAQAAIITSKRYSVESIVDSWNKLFAKL